MAGTKTLVTAEQLQKMGSDSRLELVRGELVEMSPVNWTHARIVGLLLSWLLTFVTKGKLGQVGTEAGFILARNPDLVRAPDISFLSNARLRSVAARGFVEGAPDLAVEVVSPDDKAGELEQKIREYLAAGTRLVWKVDPQSETVTAYHPSGEARVYSGDQAVPGEDVLPGFSFLPAELFRETR